VTATVPIVTQLHRFLGNCMCIELLYRISWRSERLASRWYYVAKNRMWFPIKGSFSFAKHA